MKEKLYISYDDKLVISKLSNLLSNEILKIKKNYDKIVFVCIGTDRSTGDSYGPLVGTMLSSNINSSYIKIYGKLGNTANALVIDKINNKIDYNNSLVISIDAGLNDNNDHVGCIKISNDPVFPGSSLNKDLSKVGDISIIGIVSGSNYCNNFISLDNVSLGLIYDMAIVTYKSINEVIPLNKMSYNNEYSSNFEFLTLGEL